MYSFINDVDFHGLHSLKNASKELYQKCGIKEPLKEIDVIELYQPYSFGGLMWLESMGLCKEGEAPQLLWDGVTDMEGELPVNPSGGVIATNPIGATGLIRCAEVAMQIMGKAEGHQVSDVKIGMSTGFGGCMWSDVLLYGKKKPHS
jgi:acetyl-CoA C-acetyltransferase